MMAKHLTALPNSTSPYFFWLILTFILVGCDQGESSEPNRKTEQYQGTIVAMGDSLTAGLGVSLEESYPEQLKSLLRDAGLNYDVVNSGVSGETSSGAKARIDWVLKLKPDIVILETGANDGFRGVDPTLIEENIRSIIETLRSHDVQIVLAGMQMVTNLGPDYLTRFNQLYPTLAASYPVVFMPFFLKDVAMSKEYNQEDGIHPNAEGYTIIAHNIFPYVKTAIESHESIVNQSTHQ